MSDTNGHYDAVVIGSGFGGSINALRLAEAGKSVLVLERGKRYKPGEFPRDVRDVDKLFWRYPKRAESKGLYDIRFFSGIAAVVASGVGGGSLVYANIHIRPDAVVFEDPRWPRAINRQSLDPYYDKVAKTLDIAPIPPEVKLVKRDVYRAAAEKMGRSVFDPDMAVKWGGPAENGREPCRLVAECEFGCQYGAKNTLDFNYLARAESLGARVRPGSHVTRIEPDGAGYRVHYKDVAGGAESSVTGRRVVLSAGTLGTNEILLRCRDVYRTLPNLSRRLGHGYSGNGDFLGSIQNSKTDLQPWVGTDVTSVIRYFDVAPQFTMAAPTFNKAVMEVIASLGQGDGKWVRPFASLLYPLMNWLTPLAFKKGLLSKPSKRPGPNAGDPARMTNLFAIGRDNANGMIRLKNGGIDIEWDYERENSALIGRQDAAMREVAGIYGGTYAPLISWSIFRRIITVHSLGGCHLSDSPEAGVVSVDGEVHGHPGLFVADGSVIPTAIGFHPVMTISAISERIAEAVVNSF
ncbi:MAG: GMC family oxidoreductase [Acidobacteria bacterium]|nr:GMC family oxidoreductase [Acidobacteriota bacterium]